MEAVFLENNNIFIGKLIRFFQYHQIIFGHIKCIEICNPVSSRAHKLSTWILLFAYVLFFAKCIKESSNLSTLRCLNILQGKHDVQNAKPARFHLVYNITKWHNWHKWHKWPKYLYYTNDFSNISFGFY